MAERLANMTQSDAGKQYGKGMDSFGKFAEAIVSQTAAIATVLVWKAVSARYTLTILVMTRSVSS